MRKTPYIALVSDEETFDPETHSRLDIEAFSVEIPQSEEQIAIAKIEMRNPRAILSSLSDRRIFISERGHLIFDGRISLIPRGSVSKTISIEAVAREDDLDDQISALVESLKVPPYWDPLFVASGSENDPSEILAGYSKVLAYSRTGGGVAAVDALGGATTLEIIPEEGSLDYERDLVPAAYSLKISAAWKQALQQTFRDDSVLFGLKTMTPDEIASSLRWLGANMSEGFSVLESNATVRADAFGNQDVEELTQERDISEDELDPIFIEAGTWEARAQIATMDVALSVEYTGEVNRKESCTLIVSPGLQADADDGTTEEEQVNLRSLAAQATTQPWQPQTEYSEGDQVVDAGNVYGARVDHFSGNTRAAENWTLIGEASYIASRRAASFFRSGRGQEAIAHAMERLRARARFASRSVMVSFSAPMPNPWLVTEDCQISLSHPRLPGGQVVGRLVEYTLSWKSDGTRMMSGRIAAAVGADEDDTAEFDIDPGYAPSSSARVVFSVENDGEDQRTAFENQDEIRPTKIKVQTIPPAATDFDQEVSVSISGEIGVPSGVNI